jgi:hypothetical protein
MALTVNYTGFDGLAGTETLPTGGSEDSVVGFAPGLQNHIGVLHGVVDVALSGGTNTSTDTYQAIYIPADTRILDAWFVVREAEATGTTGQVSLGIGGDVDEFVTAATVAVANVVHYSNGDHAALAIAGTYVAAADTIDLTVSVADLHNAVFDVYALVVDCKAGFR